MNTIDVDFFSRLQIGGKRMAKFTWEQIEVLRQNLYVRKVGAIEVSFTGEFKGIGSVLILFFY